MRTVTCPHCGSVNLYFDQAFGFYKCEDCSSIWAFPEDDPDYDDDPDYEFDRFYWEVLMTDDYETQP